MACEHRNKLDDFIYGGKRCPICRHQIYKRHYEGNKEKILEKASKYRKENAEKVKEIKQKYKEKLKNLTRITNTNLSTLQLRYANALKAIIYDINKLERRYQKLKRSPSARC